MTRPDLSDPEQRRAYRTELRRVYWPWRTAALAMVFIGLMGVVGDRSHELIWSAVLIAGILFVFAVIVARTRYHLRRTR